MRILVAVMSATLLFGACSDEGGVEPGAPVASETSDPLPSTSPTTIPSSTSTPVPEAACANQDSIVADPDLRARGRLTGDLEADGVPEEISLAVDEGGPPGCQAFVVAESEGATRAVEVGVPDLPFKLGFPRLISLVLVDDRPGAEIVVGVSAGASTQFAAVYTSIDGRLVQVVREGAASPQDNLLGFGGSVGHQSAFDCAPDVGPGVVVVSEAQPVGNGARFRFIRRFFSSSSPGVMAEDESLRDEGFVRFDRFDTLHEFPNAPFGSCSTDEGAG